MDSNKNQTTEVDSYEQSKNSLKTHKREEGVAGIGALAAGAFAMYEHHRAKVDPEAAGKHKLEGEVAATLGVVAGGFAFHEHHKAKQGKEEVQQEWAKKKGDQSGQEHQKHHHGLFK